MEIAYYEILGKPLIMYFGILTLISFITTAALGHFPQHRKIHIIFATISVILALGHGGFGIAAYF